METKARTRRGLTDKLPTLRLRGPLGMALGRYRMAKGLGLNELARLAKVDPAQLSRLEGGGQGTAHATTLRKLAKVLEVDAEHLMRLAAISRAYAWTTESTDEEFVAALRKAGELAGVETAIQRDPTIPPKRKKWLLECVSLARQQP